MTDLDVTDWKLKGKDLEDEVSKRVDAAAKEMKDVPSKLILTGKQFKDMTGILLPIYHPGAELTPLLYSQSIQMVNDNMFLSEEGYPMELEVRDVVIDV